MGKVGVEITDAAAMEPTAAPAGATMSDITSSTSSASNHKNNLFIRMDILLMSGCPYLDNFQV